MSNPNVTLTSIPAPRVAFIDPRTGLMAREWYLFFLNLFNLTGSGSNTISLSDLQVGPPVQDLSGDFATVYDQAQLASMVAQYEEIIKSTEQTVLLTPPIQVGTLSQLNQDFVPWVTFETVPSNVPPTVGTVAWDGGTTLGVQMTTNVLGRVNQSGYYYIKASSAITKGQVIMFTGAVGASGVPTGAPATGVTNGSYIMGIAAESIANNGFGLVQFIGTLRGVDLSAYTDGDILWYNPAVTGGLTKTEPTAPNVKVQMAAVISASNNGTMLIRVTAGSTLGGTDSNVKFGTLANGDLIQYDSAQQYWKNVAASSIVIGTATNLAGGVAGSLPYQSGVSTTTFLGIGAANTVLTSSGTAPQWSTSLALTGSISAASALLGNGSTSTANLSLFNSYSTSKTGQVLFRSNNNFDAGLGIASVYAVDVGTINESRGELVLATSWDGAPSERARVNRTGFSLLTGNSYQINGTSVLNSTTLGSGVTGSSLTSVGTLTSGTWNATAIGVGYGGTGLTSYSTGDMLYASGATTLSKLALGTTNYVMLAGASAPQWVAQSTLSVGSATTATTANAVANAVTFNTSGGAAAGTTYNGSAARTIDYSTVGAPSTSGTGATGTWGISISGNAATATSATSATNATNATNVGITRDTTTTYGYLTWSASASGNNNLRVTDGTLYWRPGINTLYATNYAGTSASMQGNGAVYTVQWQADGGSAEINFKNSSGTSLWTIGGGVTIRQDELSFRHQGTVALYLQNDAAVKFPSIGTTASAANAFLDSGNSNNILRSTSSVRYKTDIEAVNPDESAKIFQLRPIWYRSTAKADKPEWSWFGLSAEHTAEVQPRLVNWSYLPEDYVDEEWDEHTSEVDDRGVPQFKTIKQTRKVLKDGAKLVPDGVQYERLGVLLLAELTKLRNEFDEYRASHP